MAQLREDVPFQGADDRAVIKDCFIMNGIDARTLKFDADRR